MAKKNYNGVEFDDSVDYSALMDKAAAAGNNEFQSTRPVWGATPAR